MGWTLILITVGCTGLWLAPKNWAGWAIVTFSELLWFAYAITIRSLPLAAMAVIWGALNLRATLIAKAGSR